MDLEPTSIIIVLLTGVAAGVINTVAGGGSLLSLPILIFMGLPPAVANATNRVAIFSQGVSAILGFRSKGVSTWPYSLYLGVSALFGALLGARISLSLDEELFRKIIAVVMVVVVVLTVFKPFQREGGQKERMDRKYRVTGMVTFFFIGIYGGFIQAGVGFLIIAALGGIHRMNLVHTNGVKVVVVFVYTIASLGVFIYEGLIDWPIGLTLAIGTATGAWIGSRWSVDKGDRFIKAFLLVMVILLAIKLSFPQLFA